MRTTSRVRVLMAAMALPVTLLAAACSGDGDAPGSAPSASGAPPLATSVSVGQVAGKLPDPTAQRVATEVAGVVDGWVDAAYVGGDYPRDGFADVFPGFTQGAAADARQDLRLMSNADIGARIDGVTAVARAVRVDLLAVKGSARGATAHVRLAFKTTGEVERRVTVRGRLLLTRVDGAWRVFGYDVSKGDK